MTVEVNGKQIELEAPEARVLGCLIEKELSTPAGYPMTVNALVSACNQRTNREPVVDYSESDVLRALDGLQRHRLVGTATSTHGRTTKYRHALAEVMGLQEPHLAALASLLLRGPETAGEVRARTARMHGFPSLEHVDAVLDELVERELVAERPLRPGQKEIRYVHLFADVPEPAIQPTPAPEERAAAGRVEKLERDLEELRQTVAELADAFRVFKQQFE